MQPKRGHRIAWVFALGYFAFYAPYCALIKLVTSGRVPGVPVGMSGFELLPATILGTIVAMVGFLTFAGWWHHVQKPSPALIASGVGTGVIIATTTIAYTFSGISIVFALLLMRCGVLILAPLVDLAMRRSVRWFCWTAFALSLVAVAIAASDVGAYQMTVAATLNLAAYLAGYAFRLPAMTHVAKVDDAVTTRRFFATELVVALATLLVFPFAVGLLFRGQTPAAVSRGLTWHWQTPVLVPALLIGVLYAGLYVFGTLIYLDRRENTFCIPLNRAASLVAGVVAAYCLYAWYNIAPPSIAQFVAVIPIAAALVLLSPAHHLFEFARAAGTMAKKQRSGP
jgi:hypothetical protein